MSQAEPTAGRPASVTAAVRKAVIEALLAAKRAGPWTVESLRDDEPLGARGLEIGSLPLLQIFVQMENIFGFTFDDASVARASFTTVGELVAFIADSLHARPGGAERSS